MLGEDAETFDLRAHALGLDTFMEDAHLLAEGGPHLSDGVVFSTLRGDTLIVGSSHDAIPPVVLEDTAQIVPLLEAKLVAAGFDAASEPVTVSTHEGGDTRVVTRLTFQSGRWIELDKIGVETSVGHKKHFVPRSVVVQFGTTGADVEEVESLHDLLAR